MGNLKNISNDILKIQENIKISEEEKKRKKMKKEANEFKKEILICNKFSIKNKKPEIVDKKSQKK